MNLNVTTFYFYSIVGIVKIILSLAFLISSFAIGSEDLFQQLLSEKKILSKPPKVTEKHQYQYFESKLPNHGKLICKPFFVSMNSSEPYSGIFKSKDSQFYALVNQGNKPEVISSAYSLLNVDLKAQKIPRTLFKFYPYLSGPFKTQEEAAQSSCDSYYRSKLGLIKNHFVKNMKTKNQKFDLKMNVGHSAEILNSSFNHDVDCNFSKINAVHWQFSPFQTRALVFGLNSQFYAYIQPVKLEPIPESQTVFFSGPFTHLEKAAQKSCQIQFDETKRQQINFEKTAEPVDLKKVCQLQESTTKKIEDRFPFIVKLALLSQPQHHSLTFQEFLEFAEFSKEYSTFSVKQRSEKTKGSELFAKAEDYLLSFEKPEAMQAKLAQLKEVVKIKLSKENEIEQRVLLQFPRKFWKVIYYPKKSSDEMAKFHSKLNVSEVEYLKFDEDRKVTIHDKESVLKMICDSAKNLF
jgi:hypothetical protein